VVGGGGGRHVRKEVEGESGIKTTVAHLFIRKLVEEKGICFLREDFELESHVISFKQIVISFIGLLCHRKCVMK